MKYSVLSIVLRCHFFIVINYKIQTLSSSSSSSSSSSFSFPLPHPSLLPPPSLFPPLSSIPLSTFQLSSLAHSQSQESLLPPFVSHTLKDHGASRPPQSRNRGPSLRAASEKPRYCQWRAAANLGQPLVVSLILEGWRGPAAQPDTWNHHTPLRRRGESCQGLGLFFPQGNVVTV